MVALLALVTRILSVLTTVVGYTQAILGFTSTAAQESSRLILETIASNAANTVNSPTFGNAALLAAIADAKAQGIADTAAIILAITDLTDGTTPVSLPVSPPSGYGAPTDSNIFNAVWTGLKSPDVVTPYEFLRVVGTRIEFISGYASLAQADANFYYTNPNYDEFGVVGSFYPVFDLALLSPTDDLLSFVTTCNPGATVAWTPSTGLQVFVSGSTGDGTTQFITTWNEATFQQLKATIFPIASTVLAPVWPGVGSVTMGSPTAIASQLTVTGPMDGIQVNITSVSPSKPSVPYDTQNAYKFIGAIAFVDDNGDVEPYQQLSFANALYCPKLMTRATSVVVRADPSVVGTVTPWVIA